MLCDKKVCDCRIHDGFVYMQVLAGEVRSADDDVNIEELDTTDERVRVVSFVLQRARINLAV